MSKTVILTKEQLKQLARYEITFKDIIDVSSYDEIVFICDEYYQYTLEDLYEALKNIQRINPTDIEYKHYWEDRIEELDEFFMLYDDIDEYIADNQYIEYKCLLESDYDLFSYIWDYMDLYYSDVTGCKINEIIDFDELINEIQIYMYNKDKPMDERIYNKKQKETFIELLSGDKNLAKATDNELKLCRIFIEELILEDNITALHTKGYATYGGNRLYPCDWHISEACMLRLYALTDDAVYANTLGYIYYYGRTNNGIPDYDHAFRYFSISAANGFFEGVYKLADMYYHGYGCKQSDLTAYNLYRMVYDVTYKEFLKGNNTTFADAAIRMGNVYAKGITEKPDLYEAYKYYLQGEYAAALRVEENDFFGYQSVLSRVRETLAELKPKVQEVDLELVFKFNGLYYLKILASDNYKCKLIRTKIEDNVYELHASRIPTKSVPYPESILITIPELHYCKRDLGITLIFESEEDIYFCDNQDTILYDYIEYDYDYDHYKLFYNFKLVGFIRANNPILKI